VRNPDTLACEDFNPCCAQQGKCLPGSLLFGDIPRVSYSAFFKDVKEQRIKCMKKKGIKQEICLVLTIHSIFFFLQV